MNEGLNNIIWSKCPRNIFVEKSVLEMGVNSAILHFNDGSSGIQSVFNCFGISTGRVSRFSMEKSDRRSVVNAQNKASEKSKKRRKKLRAIKKGLLDKEVLNEGGGVKAD